MICRCNKKKAGLPPYKCAVTFRRKEDREKLPAFPCPDCRAVSCKKN